MRLGFALGIVMLAASGADAGKYGAVAIGTNESKIAIGLSYGLKTSNGASDFALSQCRKSPTAGTKWRIITTWGNKKCGYVSIGASAQGSGSGTGDTAALAYRNYIAASKGRNECGKAI
jgi:hypothetical protein